jgi:hypothetical protein
MVEHLSRVTVHLLLVDDVRRDCGCILSCYLICKLASELLRTRGFSCSRRVVLQSRWPVHCEKTRALTNKAWVNHDARVLVAVGLLILFERPSSCHSTRKLVQTRIDSRKRIPR